MKELFDVKSCNKIENNMYEIVLDGKEKISEEQYNYYLTFGCDWSALKDSVFDTFYFQFDGDYLYIYLADRKTLFATYCAYDESEYRALVEAVATNNFDNMEFTFPRHADGTCDYDESAWESARKPGTGISLRTGKATTVKENLRVLSDDRTTSAVRITLAAGTPVEILGIGDEETIDGITSKWVHVKVMPGTLGTDGTYIEWGYVLGWCFGGVVSDMEGMAESTSETTNIEETENAPDTEEHAEPAEEVALPEAAESESPSDEPSAAKQNAALPILPIAAGVAALAVLLAVVLFAGKKRKASEGVKNETMDDINEIYKFIGEYLVSNIQSEDWKKIILNIEIDDKYRSFQGAYFDSCGIEHDLGIVFSFDFGKKIKEFHRFTKENNFTPWNRAVYTLERSGRFDIEFKWDQALQDEWNKD